ncbi:MAG: carboxypeptidase-like regulatory domain-containing protein [Acidobacteria bacterium]|nr:carboxypeptidase-like regulatory domain-containing protein [Acidobacteriota bacterium]
MRTPGRTLGWLLVAALVLPAAAAPVKTASLSGQVRSAVGVAQMGARVEIFASAASEILTLYTDGQGYYHARDVLPGKYFVKVSAASFLPTLREDVSLRAGAHLVVNLTLNTLNEAIQLLSPSRRPATEDDDWKWTLRSTANRPVLRLQETGPLIVVTRSDGSDDRVLKASVTFLAAADAGGLGGPDVATAFSVERSLFSTGTLSVNGNVAPGQGNPAAILRAAYRHRLPDGSAPEVALTVRRFATIEDAARYGALESLALSVSDTITLAEFVELNVGGELQTVQYRGRASALRPFGSVSVHLSPHTVARYRYATSQPNTRMAKGFDTAPADLSESGPRMSLAGGAPLLERARHHEVSLSRRFGNTSVQVAAYSDNIANPALTGVGDVDTSGGDLLPDVYSGTFAYTGADLETNGLRAVVERRFSDRVLGTVTYTYGGVLDLQGEDVPWEQVSPLLYTARRHAVTGKVSGSVPGARTRWITSYKWLSGSALTPVDMFDASPGQADPYLNIFIRQPIPYSGSLPGQVEMLVDVRNLLAQGYVPVVGQDGETVFLVQSARSIRGGISFTF